MCASRNYGYDRQPGGKSARSKPSALLVSIRSFTTTMKKSKIRSLFLIFPALFAVTLLCGNAFAADDDSGTGLSEADRTMMAEGAQKYRMCLHKEANAILNQYKDVRKIADLAMKKCAPMLGSLETQLKATKDISPELAAGFVHYSANSGARQLLKELIEERAAAASSR